jgi:hypothetical protein
MSNEADEPKTVRDALRIGLGDKWTKELEDALFWPVADFVDRAGGNLYQKGKADALEHLRQAGVLGERFGT